MDAAGWGALAAWAAVPINVAVVAYGRAANRRDRHRYNRELVPKITATYDNALEGITFKNEDQEDFVGVQICLDTERTEWAVMTGFRDSGPVVDIKELPRTTAETFQIASSRASGTAYFTVVCQNANKDVLTGRIACIIEVPQVWVAFR